MISSFLINDNRRNKISRNEIINFSSKKEFNNKKVKINLKKNNNLNIEKLELDLDEITNNDNNLKKFELNWDNKSKHLKEDRKRRRYSEPIEKKRDKL